MDIQKPVIGVDFDDVLFKCNDALAEFHNATYGTSYAREDVRTFDLGEVWSCTPEEAQRRINEFTSTDFHHDAEAVFGAYDALKILAETHDIVIVTARLEKWRDATITWLEKNFIGLYREVHFTEQFHTDQAKRRQKSEVVRALGMSAFIDDSLHQVDDVSSLGIPVFLFDTPWNQGPLPGGVARVHSWQEILTALLPVSFPLEK